MRVWQETLVLYGKLLGIAFKSLTQFRADFLIGIAGIITMNGINLLAIGVILERFHDLAGWTVWEIVFLYGLWMTGNSLFSLLFFHLTFLEEYIVQGALDKFLVRPASPFLQLLAADVNLNGIADVIFGLATLGMAMSNLQLRFDAGQWLFLAVMLVSGALIEAGMTLALSSVAFWTGKSAALVFTVNQLNWNMTQQYPLEMFGRGFQVLVTCFIPVAFINYYPARWLLGKTTPGDPWYFLSFLSPLVAAILLAIAALVWQKGLRQYNSTGS
jgi:ABC-2 type transport system permease protein